MQETFFHVALDLKEWHRVVPYFAEIVPTALEVAQPDSPVEAVSVILHHLPADFTEILQTSADCTEIPQKLQEAIQASPLFKLVEESLSKGVAEQERWLTPRISPTQLPYFAEIITMLLLSCPQKLYRTLDENLQAWFSQVRQQEKLAFPLDREVLKLQEQMAALQELSLNC